MFPNVRVELARKQWNMLDLANATGIRYQTLTLKLKGKSVLTFDEAVSIKAALESKLSLEDLFGEVLVIEEVP